VFASVTFVPLFRNAECHAHKAAVEDNIKVDLKEWLVRVWKGLMLLKFKISEGLL
jgi:hypothetical protein